MAKLDDALVHLGELSGRPPYPPASHDELRRLVTQRRRRMATRSLLAVMVLVGVEIVASDRDGAVSTSSTASTTTQNRLDLLVEPSEGLHPNDEVTITLPVEPDPNDVIVAQCGSEAATASPELWCSVVTTGGALSSPLTVRVQRVIQVSADSGRRIDCAERPGRCLIGIRTRGQDFFATIGFDPDLPALGVPTLAAEVLDNRFVAVTGSGYLPATEITITQCRRRQDQAPSAPDVQDCDFTRATRAITDAQGQFSVEIPIYREVFEAYSGWTLCQPCQIAVHGTTFDTVATTIDASGGLSERPTVTIQPAGPYRPGQLVELHGTAFPPDAPFEEAIAWCRFATDDPATEVSGAGPGYASCRYPPGIDAVTTSDTGEFTIVDFPLPDEAFGCREPGARCGLAVHPSEGSLPLFVTEFEISP